MSRKVLIVDDDPTIRTLLRDYLEALGFEILHAIDGRCALEIFDREFPDLIITDIFMPEMTGVELAEKVKSGDHPIPIILISGVQLSEAEIQMQRERSDGFLEKPYMFWQLREVISKLVPDAVPAQAVKEM
ncbi:MAG: response regulator [bacterium]|nr:response regulator [bacterium]